MCVIVMFCYISAVSVLVLAVKGMFCVCNSHVLLYFSCISASSSSEGHVCVCIVMFCYISAVSVLVLAVKGMFCVCYSHVLCIFSCISASSSSEGHVLCV